MDAPLVGHEGRHRACGLVGTPPRRDAHAHRHSQPLRTRRIHGGAVWEAEPPQHRSQRPRLGAERRPYPVIPTSAGNAPHGAAHRRYGRGWHRYPCGQHHLSCWRDGQGPRAERRPSPSRQRGTGSGSAREPSEVRRHGQPASARPPAGRGGSQPCRQRVGHAGIHGHL